MSLGDRAARGSGIVLVTQLLRAVLRFGSVVALARLLTPTQFGLVAMVTAVIGVADLIRDFGLSTAAIQTKSISRDEQTNLFWVNVLLGLGCAGLTLAAQPLIVAGYDEPRIGPIIVALAFVFVVSGANTQFRADLTRRLRFFPLAMSDVAAQAVGIAVAVVLAVAHQGVWAIVAQQIVTAVVALVINVVNAGWLPGRYRRGVSLRRFFRFGGGVLGTQVIMYFTKNVDNIALGAVWGAAPLGLYSRAYQLLLTPLNQINAPMTDVALPVLSRIHEDKPRYNSYLGKAQLVACYLTSTVFAVATGLAAPIVLVLFGPRWTAVAPVFAILAVGGIFRSVSQIAYWTYLSSGLTGAQFKLILWTRPVMIGIILAGLPWGPVGVAVGHSVAYFLYWVAGLVDVGRKAKVDTGLLFRNARRAILYVSAPSGVLAFGGALIPVPALLQILLGLTFATTYLALVTWLVPSVRDDAVLLYSFARRSMAGRRAPRSPAPAGTATDRLAVQEAVDAENPAALDDAPDPAPVHPADARR